jgi:hypothetical protein
MDVTSIFAVAISAFALLVLGIMVVLLRAVDRGSSARDREMRAVLEQIRGKVESLEVASREASLVRAAAAPARTATVDIGGEPLELDAEMLARLEAVIDQSGGESGMEALRDALTIGLAMAERGFVAKGEGEQGTGEQSGRVVPLRPRGKGAGKPPGSGGEGQHK